MQLRGKQKGVGGSTPPLATFPLGVRLVDDLRSVWPNPPENVNGVTRASPCRDWYRIQLAANWIVFLNARLPERT